MTQGEMEEFLSDLIYKIQHWQEHKTPIEKIITENFEKQGRPVRWRKVNKQKGRMILVDTGELMAAATHPAKEWIKGDAKVFEPDLPPYGPVHQHGFFGKVFVPEFLRRSKDGKMRRVKSYYQQMNIPARPFFVVPDMDGKLIVDAVMAHIFGWRAVDGRKHS
jgi:phage gpG-like protein